MRRNLSGCRVLLTGGSRGIGRATTEELLRRGAKVVICARHATVAAPPGVILIPGDLTVAADRERIVAEAAERLGGLDLLINNAGTCSFGEFSTSSEAVLRQIMEINFFAPAEMCRLCLPHLTATGKRPAIVNIASIVGKRGIPSFPEHSASKFALVGLSEALRCEFVRFGVDVLLVIPGLAKVDDFEKHLLRNEGKIFIDWNNVQSAEAVAAGIVRAIERNKAETVIGWLALQIYRLQNLWPAMLDSIMARKVMKFDKKV